MACLSASAATTTQRQGSVSQVSLMGRYRITPAWSVQLYGSNLCDKTHHVLDQCDTPATARNARVTLRARF